LVLNKADLLDEAGQQRMDQLINLYLPLDYPVLTASAADARGLDALRTALIGKTSVFVGQSGVGKSSLINALMPQAALATADISSQSGLGQHTTVTAQLLPFPDGGDLIDSPGVREFGLWHISEEELLSGYTELAPLAGACRFRNCSHRHEPGCALHAAAAEGRISQERLDNFFHIAGTLDEDARERY
jgi:ribosome biogenesis GTPase